MTISIHIEAPNATEARSQMAELLGTTLIFAQPDEAAQKVSAEKDVGQGDYVRVTGDMNDNGGISNLQVVKADAPAPTRERGQPSPGKARRTKAEIAEDDAADKATAEGPLNGLGGTTGSDAVAAISTGEERLSPEDTPEDAAADAADEAAETAATKTDKLTTEDVRNGMGIYVTKYGIEAIQLDGLEVFNRVLGPCPLKNEKGDARTWKVSDLPDDQAVLKRIVDGFAEMTSLNPFKRTAKVA